MPLRRLSGDCRGGQTGGEDSGNTRGAMKGA
jgi:hypothetical protein